MRLRIQKTKYIIETDKNINVKIAHVSDIHFSENYKLKRFEKIIEKIKTIEPKYICITGDIIDTYEATKSKQLYYLKKFINDLAQIGKVIISIGNHEYIHAPNIDWLKKIETEKIKVLDNEILEEENISFIGYNPDYKYYYEYNENRLSIYNKELEQLIEKSKNEYKIQLLHTPMLILKKDNYKKINNISKIQFILSGHTHGGMMPSFIPGHTGIVSPTKELFPKNIRGKIKKDNTTVIISSGIIKLSKKSKLDILNDIYSSNIIEICIKQKIINKKYWFYKKNMVFLDCKQDRA